MRGKYKLLTLLFVFIVSLTSSAYLFLPDHFQSLDSRVRDFYFKFRGAEKTDDSIIIVDIDERSIKELGQWPWEREKVATILQNLSNQGAAIIGLDIIFSEADKTSPHAMAKEWNLHATNLPDYDLILAKTIAQTPAILGYVFDFNDANENEAPQIPAVFVEKSKQPMEFLPQAKGVLTNIPLIQNAGYSSGYLNNIPDESGVIRSVPLLIGYDMEIYPSLAFEMYRLIRQSNQIVTTYSEAGVASITLEDTSIACDRFGRLHLNFRGPAKSYKYISALDVFNDSVAKEQIQGKYIFIGTSAYGIMDLRATPMDSVIAGVEIHANMLDNLLKNDMLYKPSWGEVVDLLSIFVTAFISIYLFSRFSLLPLIFSFTVAFAAMLFFTYTMLFSYHVILNIFFPFLGMFLSLLSVLSINYLFETRQKELIKGSFSKKVSKEVMEDLLSHPEDPNLSSREVNATIYFSDIRSFTTISETLASPKRITDFLNFYMDAMVAIVEKYHGTIDKFIGDAIMVYWNAPLPIENHADKAVTTALEQIQERDNLNQIIREKFNFEVDYGIGINTGDVVVGEIGSKGRSDYTIIGDAVNLASRLEGLCKAYKVRLVISEFTKELLQERYVLQLLDIVQVKGKHEPVKIYEVLSKGEASQEKQAELEAYNRAHGFYMQGEFIQAEKAFTKLFETYDKYLYTLYAKRSQELEEKHVTNFNGVFAFTTK